MAGNALSETPQSGAIPAARPPACRRISDFMDCLVQRAIGGETVSLRRGADSLLSLFLALKWRTRATRIEADDIGRKGGPHHELATALGVSQVELVTPDLR